MDIETQEQTTVEETSVDDNNSVDNLSLDDIAITAVDTDDDSYNTSEQEETETSEEGEETASETTDDSTSEEETSTEETDDDDAGGTAADTVEETSSAEQVTIDETDADVAAYNALSEETGVEVSSEDDIVSSLKELASIREKGSTNGLSKAIQSAIEVEKSGGNLAEHFARVGMVFDKMDGKEVMRQKFFKDNAKLHNDNPKLAQMKFEKGFQREYGNWVAYEKLTDDEDKSDFVDENGQDNIDYDKMMLDNDIALAKEELEAWKEEATPVAQQQQSGGMTEEEATTHAANYKLKADKEFGEFEAVAIPLGEGVNDFSLGLNEKTKPMVEGWVNDPSQFLKSIGFEGAEIDVNRLLPIMTLIAEASVGNLGGRLAKALLDSDNLETIRTKIQKQTKPVIATPDTSQEGDDWDKVGNAAEEARIKSEGR